jgi:hypothetical protein
MKINKRSHTSIMLCLSCTLFFTQRCCRLDYLIAWSMVPHYNPLLWEGTTLYPIVVCIFIWRFFTYMSGFATKYSLGKTFLVVTKVIMMPNLGLLFPILYLRNNFISISYILESCEAQQRDWLLFPNRNLFSSCTVSYQCWHLEPCKATSLCG